MNSQDRISGIVFFIEKCFKLQFIQKGFEIMDGFIKIRQHILSFITQFQKDIDVLFGFFYFFKGVKAFFQPLFFFLKRFEFGLIFPDIRGRKLFIKGFYSVCFLFWVKDNPLSLRTFCLDF
jgi:hypothetical protein